MNNAVKWGVILAVVVAVINLVVLATGLHANPIVGMVSILAFIVANIVVIVLALRATRGEKGYGGQLVQSMLIGVVGGVCIFVVSYLLLNVVFPDAISETKDGYVAMLESAGMPEDQLDANIAKIEEMSGTGEATKGAVFTFFTTLVVGSIGGIFLRKK